MGPYSAWWLCDTWQCDTWSSVSVSDIPPRLCNGQTLFSTKLSNNCAPPPASSACHRELNKHPQLGQQEMCSLVVWLNVWGWKRMEWLCHHYLESARNAAAKLGGLSALSSSTIAQPTFLLVPADNSGQLPWSTQVNLFLNLPSHCLIPLISPPFPL